jgi:hypothetical protein
MNSSRVRLGVVVLVLFAAAAGVWVLAAPPQPYFLIKCSKYTCPGPGECGTPTSGRCTQGKNGPGFGANLECCCCTGDAANRWFHGE